MTMLLTFKYFLQQKCNYYNFLRQKCNYYNLSVGEGENIKHTRLESLPGTNTNLLRTFVSYGCKKFYNIGPRTATSRLSTKKWSRTGASPAQRISELSATWTDTFGTFTENWNLTSAPFAKKHSDSRAICNGTSRDQCYNTFFVRNLRIFLFVPGRHFQLSKIVFASIAEAYLPGAPPANRLG